MLYLVCNIAKFGGIKMDKLPSMEKPWEKYYNLEELNKIREKLTVYQQIVETCKEFPNNLALEFFGMKKDFKELQKNIDKTAKAFKEYGVKKGDFVTVCSAGIPEVVYTFYAQSKLGAVCNMIAPHFDKKDLINRIEDCESDLIIIMDKFYEGLKETIKKSRIKNVVILPTLNSSLLRFVSKKYKLEKNSNELYWNQFIKDGKSRKNINTVQYEENMPVAMVYSSGTTGASKGILLSNDTFQNSINSYRASGVKIESGKKFYQIIPPWFSTGLNTSMHLPLSMGTAVFQDPRFERDVFVKNIIKSKPNYTVAPTSMYEGFLDETLVGDADLSHFIYPCEGGEPLTGEVAQKIEKVFKDHNNPVHIVVGYGQCECGATISTETTKTCHTDASVGIPLPGVNIKIVDDNMNELSYYERGQIIVSTPCSMIGYFNNDVANNEYFYYDQEGTKWNCTGDIGYIDESGQLYVNGRATDYTIIENKKIYHFDIEEALRKRNEIKNCDVLSCDNGDGTRSLVVHIILNEAYEGTCGCYFLEEIQDYLYNIFQDVLYVPHVFKLRSSFPYAPSGKRDILKMMQETDGFIEFPKYEIKTKKKS